MNPFPLPKVGDRIILGPDFGDRIVKVYAVDEETRRIAKVSRDAFWWSWDYEMDDAIPYTKLTCYLQGIEYEENP
jgi:hypothetical protein